jgi:hypothetical protein
VLYFTIFSELNCWHANPKIYCDGFAQSIARQRLSKHVLLHAPRNNTVEVFSLCSPGQLLCNVRTVTSHNSGNQNRHVTTCVRIDTGHTDQICGLKTALYSYRHIMETEQMMARLPAEIRTGQEHMKKWWMPVRKWNIRRSLRKRLQWTISEQWRSGTGAGI